MAIRPVVVIYLNASILLDKYVSNVDVWVVFFFVFLVIASQVILYFFSYSINMNFALVRVVKKKHHAQLLDLHLKFRWLRLQLT